MATNPDHKLDELLRPGLDLVVCGTAASPESARKGCYYAGPGNRFWATLAEVGLTPELLRPSDFERLLEYGIGLTDVVKDQAAVDADLVFGGSGAALRDRVRPYGPRYVCFNGKRAASEALVRKVTSYGLLPETLGATRLFVAPSTSAAARRWWSLAPWKEIAERVRASAGSGPGGS